MAFGDARDGVLPALRFRSLTALYDPVVGVLTREGTFKRRLVKQAGIAPGHEVLDLGCGTGTLTLMVAECEPGAAVRGIDADPAIWSARGPRRRGRAWRWASTRAWQPSCPTGMRASIASSPRSSCTT